MPTSRLTVVLGPLIALLLIGGLVVTVVRGPGDGAPPADDIARDDRTAEPQTSEPQASQTDSETPASELPASEPTEEPATPLASPSASVDPTAPASPSADPAVTPAATATAEPAASPAAAPDEPGVGGAVGVEDPTALTGGWQGGTPNTGTAVSGAGLLLLAVAAGVFWLRRTRA